MPRESCLCTTLHATESLTISLEKTQVNRPIPSLQTPIRRRKSDFFVARNRLKRRPWLDYYPSEEQIDDYREYDWKECMYTGFRRHHHTQAAEHS